ncbi:MAG: cation transporter [Planctomycetaceae bacterium]|nr:MAG: cation transporter [Planctomycetaceae bacterium]
MAIGVGLNALFVSVELGTGWWAGSLALLADAGHNAGDVVGLLLAWGAHALAQRPPTRRYTWGFRRSTIYAALFNSLLLLAGCGAILWEAVHRMRTPVPTIGVAMIAVAAAGVVINTLTALLFMRGRKHDANLRAAFLHMAADAAVSAGVVVAGIVIVLTGWTWVDPVVGMLVAIVIIVGTWDLFRESIDLAIDAVPRGINTEEVTKILAGIPGVAAVHNLHCWSVSTAEKALTVHLIVPEATEHQRVLEEASAQLQQYVSINHTTIQIASAASHEQRDRS